MSEAAVGHKIALSSHVYPSSTTDSWLKQASAAFGQMYHENLSRNLSRSNFGTEYKG